MNWMQTGCQGFLLLLKRGSAKGCLRLYDAAAIFLAVRYEDESFIGIMQTTLSCAPFFVKTFKESIGAAETGAKI
ncbi:MAG: hypothetical protein ACYCX2_03160 [Christensenellales bacterium]